MIVWLNGPHGAGKSSVARRLVRARRDRLLLDPEPIGRRLLRKHRGERPVDFKDLPAWREQTLAALHGAIGRVPAVIVPMTLPDPAHHAEIIGALRDQGIAVRQVTLMARPETLRRRIDGRIDWPGSKRWAKARAESGIAALAHELFAPHIWTDDLTPDEVVATVERLLRND